MDTSIQAASSTPTPETSTSQTPEQAASASPRTPFAKLEDFLFGPHTPRQTLEASVNKEGQAVVKTEDGFTVKFLGKHQALTITGPDGKTTKIWGDPHVTESDGDRWEFKKQTTFKFGNNKITIQTSKKPGYELTFSDTVTIYNGSDRFTITDLEVDKPRLVGWKLDGESHDEHLSDGDVYVLEREAAEERWVRESAA
ncbi:MAG: DUF1521 domain-containing protein [Bdellovibrionales bacterium]|nr:DUF1521 domain-containing protein [Bdellovibrionales bacterium]